uniref:Big defensin n=1 Tax=Ruditapes philippinarum TaxID=129788 RepID=G0Z5N4_RUDPH|nr:big defensin [Ruditapes philippinarum]
MDKRTIYFIFYVFLLTMTTPALCFKQQLEKELLTEEEQESVKLARQRRQAVLPIAAYAGMAVAPYLFAALVATYGIYLVRQYNIRKKSGHNIPCANNRGWCRPTCFSHEYIDGYHSAICGGNSCCRSRIR